MYTFHLVTPASPVKPDGRHSHQMVTQLSDQPLYVDIGVQGDPGALYGTESVYVHGGKLLYILNQLNEKFKFYTHSEQFHKTKLLFKNILK